MKKLSTAVLLVALGLGGSCGPGLEPPKGSTAGDFDNSPRTPPPGVGVGAAGASATAGRAGSLDGRSGAGGAGGSSGGGGAAGAAGRDANDGGVDDDAGQ